jgi:hypothetical protein
MWAVANAKRRARLKSVPFNLSVEFLASILTSHCPVTGRRMRIYAGLGQGPRDDSPSLDCVVRERGYVPGNVVWVSSRANRIKSDASLAELEALVAYVKEHS